MTRSPPQYLNREQSRRPRFQGSATATIFNLSFQVYFCDGQGTAERRRRAASGHQPRAAADRHDPAGTERTVSIGRQAADAGDAQDDLLTQRSLVGEVCIDDLGVSVLFPRLSTFVCVFSALWNRTLPFQTTFLPCHFCALKSEKPLSSWHWSFHPLHSSISGYLGIVNLKLQCPGFADSSTQRRKL